jgi:aminoglycoside phosphotransferase (APT) family kinase protein
VTGILESAGERTRFAAWLDRVAGIPVAAPDTIEVERPASGWSNETAILRIGARRLVLRLAPARLAMFPTYDLGREAAIIEALDDAGRPPVPRVLGHEPSAHVLGRPFFVMSFVDGCAPSDTKPSYAEAGWLAAATAGEQRRFWTDFIGCIAAVNAFDWRAGGLAMLAPAAGASSLADALDWLAGLHAWSAAPQAEIETGLARLGETRPTDAGADVLLWGDARPANVLVRDFRIAALLDWEMAGVGPAEMDVAWLLEMHWIRTAGAGVVPPPGFPDEAGIVAIYEAAAGRRLAPLGWFRLFAAVKVAVLMYRHLVVAVDRGMLRAGHPLLAENVATRRVADLLRSGGVRAA